MLNIASIINLYLIPARTLEGISIDKDGTPLRTLLVGQRRSGSSFLGELLSTHPGSYYTFEPELLLADHQVVRNKSFSLIWNCWTTCLLPVNVQIRNGSLADRANFVLKELFRCRFDAFGWFSNCSISCRLTELWKDLTISMLQIRTLQEWRWRL